MSSDPIRQPAHYNRASIEVIEVIEAFNLNYRLGNVTKYVLRAGFKDDDVEDLKKARQYLTREINARQGITSWEDHGSVEHIGQEEVSTSRLAGNSSKDSGIMWLPLRIGRRVRKALRRTRKRR